MKILTDILEGYFEMFDLWFGQGDGTGILIASLLIAVAGFFAIGLFKSRKAKAIFLLFVAICAIACGIVYQSGDMMGGIFSALIFGCAIMLILGASIRFIVQSIFAKKSSIRR